MIKVLINNAIEYNGTIYQQGQTGWVALYNKFVKRGVTFKLGATIEEKERGRPRTSTKVRKQLYIDEKHAETLDIVKQGLNLEEKIVAKINEGQEPDVRPYKIEDISISLIKFWVAHFNRENKK